MKSNIPLSCGGKYFFNRKIKCLQTLAWWVTYLMLWGKNIDLNYFKSDVMSDAIEEYQLNFEDTRDGKADLSNPKELSHKKWTQWEGRIYKYLSPLSYIIIKYTPSPDDGNNRDVQIIH